MNIFCRYCDEWEMWCEVTPEHLEAATASFMSHLVVFHWLILCQQRLELDRAAGRMN